VIWWQVWRAVFIKTCDGMGTFNSGHKGMQGGVWVVRGRKQSI